MPYDPELAKQLLAEAGWKERNEEGWLVNEEGRIFEETLTFENPSSERIYTVIQEGLKQAGIKLNLKQMTRATQFKNTMEHNFRVTFQSWSGLFWPNPNSSFHSKNAESGYNWSKFQDQELDSVLEEAYGVTDPGKAGQLYQRAEEIIMENALVLPIQDYVFTYGVRTSLGGVFYPGGRGRTQDFYNAFLEP